MVEVLVVGTATEQDVTTTISVAYGSEAEIGTCLHGQYSEYTADFTYEGGAGQVVATSIGEVDDGRFDGFTLTQQDVYPPLDTTECLLSEIEGSTGEVALTIIP